MAPLPQKMPLHQMPAANPDDPEWLTPVKTQAKTIQTLAHVKTIQTKIKSKFHPAVPVRTHAQPRAVASGAAQTVPADSPMTISLIAQPPRTKSITMPVCR